jgi:predicted DNA-binding transcriptional regulator AlpA
LDLLSTQRLLSATNITEILGVSREGLRKMRQRGEAPKSTRVGSVAVTTFDDFLTWIAGELSRTCRPRWLRRLGRAA